MRSAIVVGAGLSGLSCARALDRAGVDVTVLEASDEIGGRVRTDEVDGFLLDRGFQVLLDSYPEASRQLDFPALELCAFEPGAVVRVGNKLHKVADPLRKPLTIGTSLVAPIGSIADKLLVPRLRMDVASDSAAARFRRDRTTDSVLREYGFSDRMMRSFFRPFLGGVFLENDLETSAAKFAFVFRMFASGRATVPAKGMQRIPEQLARSIEDRVRTNCRVRQVDPGSVTLETGDRLGADAIVLAVDQLAASRLTSRVQPTASKNTVTIYFEAPAPPVEGPWLVLNGNEEGVVNHLAVMSEVSRRYASNDRTLVSVTVLDVAGASIDGLEPLVLRELETWFGRVVRDWRHIRSYRIANALPVEKTFSETPEVRLADRVWHCGDYLGNASIEGAMLSGRLTAEAIVGGV